MVACNDDAMVAIYPDRAREARRPLWRAGTGRPLF